MKVRGRRGTQNAELKVSTHTTAHAEQQLQDEEELESEGGDREQVLWPEVELEPWPELDCEEDVVPQSAVPLTPSPE